MFWKKWTLILRLGRRGKGHWGRGAWRESACTPRVRDGGIRFCGTWRSESVVSSSTALKEEEGLRRVAEQGSQFASKLRFKTAPRNLFILFLLVHFFAFYHYSSNILCRISYNSCLDYNLHLLISFFKFFVFCLTQVLLSHILLCLIF